MGTREISSAGKVGDKRDIAVDRASVIFRGFEIGRQHIEKFAVINVGSESRRLHIFPLISPHFRFYFEKLGAIAPGKAQEVRVVFVPDSYRVFTSAVRIVSEKSEIVLQISAYPVLNPDVSKIFPRCVELEFHKVGQATRCSKILRNLAGCAFDFEFRFTRTLEQLEVRPRKGVILPRSSVEIDFVYTPVSRNLDHADAELLISEHNFTPINFKIMIFPALKAAQPKPDFLKTKQGSADEKYLQIEQSDDPPEARGTSMNEIYRDENAAGLPEPRDVEVKRAPGEEEQGRFDREFEEIAERVKERKIRVLKHIGACPILAEEARAQARALVAEAEDRQRTELFAAAKNRKTLEVNSDLPQVDAELRVGQSWTRPTRETLLIFKQFCRRKFETAVKKVMVRIRLANRLRAIKENAKKSKENRIFWRPFLGSTDPPPARPAFDPRVCLPAPSAFPLYIEDLKPRPIVRSSEYKIIGSEELTYLEHVGECLYENRKYKELNPFDSYLYIPPIASEKEKRGAFLEEPFFRSDGSDGEEDPELALAFQPFPTERLPKLDEVLAGLECATAAGFAAHPVPSLTEVSPEIELSCPPEKPPDVLKVPTIPTPPIPELITEAIIRLHGYGNFMSFASLPHNQFTIDKKYEIGCDSLCIANIERYCPQKIRTVERDDVQDRDSDDSSDESTPSSDPPSKIADFEQNLENLRNHVASVNDYEQNHQEYLKLWRNIKITLIGKNQTLKSDINKYFSRTANKIYL